MSNIKIPSFMLNGPPPAPAARRWGPAELTAVSELLDDALAGLAARAHDALAEIDAAIAKGEAREGAAFEAWVAFLRGHRARIAPGGAAGLLQLAYAHGDESIATQAAESWLALGRWERPWLQRLGRPVEPVEPDPSAVPDDARAITWLGFDPSGNSLVAVDAQGQLGIWDVGSGEKTQTRETRIRSVRRGAVKPGGECVLLHDATDAVHEYLLEAKYLMTPMEGGALVRAELTADGGYYLVLSDDGLLRIWDTRRWAIHSLLERGNTERWISLPGNSVLLIEGDRLASVFDIAKGAFVLNARIPEEFDVAGELYTDGALVLSAREGRAVQVLVLEDAAMAPYALAHEGRVRAVAMHPSAELIVTAGDDGMRAWSRATGELLARWDGDVPIHAAAISANGFIALGDARGDVVLFR